MTTECLKDCLCDDCLGTREFRAQHGFDQAFEMVRSGSYKNSSDYYYAANWVADEYEDLKFRMDGLCK